jgi:2-phospho-L-lactate guanylyltransferase (CobY/MobA/RfbA family)
VKVVVVMARALDAPADTIKTRLSTVLPAPDQRRALHATCVADVVDAARRVQGVMLRVAARILRRRRCRARAPSPCCPP